jgi:hypothetical protein
MSNRTVALLMLFVAALIAAGILLALMLRVLEGTSISGPWLAPMIAVLSLTLTFYWGRRYILPRSLADASARAVLALTFTVSVTLAATLVFMWAARWIVGLGLETPSVAVPVWFALLWLVLPRPVRKGAAAI